MSSEKAKAAGITSVADLSEKALSPTLGSDLEFLSRPEWPALKSAYGLSFRAEKSYSPTIAAILASSALAQTKSSIDAAVAVA